MLRSICSICQAFAYSGNRFLNNVTVNMLGVFALNLIINTPLRSLQRCSHQTVNQTLLKFVRIISQALWVTVSLVVIVTTNVLVLRELRTVPKWGEEAQAKPDCTAVKATYLILATGAGLVLCLIPILGIELYIT